MSKFKNKGKIEKLEFLKDDIEKTRTDLEIRIPLLLVFVPLIFLTWSLILVIPDRFSIFWFFSIVGFILLVLVTYWPIARRGKISPKFCAISHLYINFFLLLLFILITFSLWFKLYSSIVFLIHFSFVLIGTFIFIYQRFLEFNIEDVNKECLSSEIYNEKTGELKKFVQTDKWQKRTGKDTLYKFEDKFLYYFKKYIVFPIIVVGPALTGLTMGIGKIGLQNQREIFMSYGALFVFYILLYMLFPKYAAYLVYTREEKRVGKQIYFTDIEVIKAELEKLNQ